MAAQSQAGHRVASAAVSADATTRRHSLHVPWAVSASARHQALEVVEEASEADSIVVGFEVASIAADSVGEAVTEAIGAVMVVGEAGSGTRMGRLRMVRPWAQGVGMAIVAVVVEAMVAVAAAAVGTKIADLAMPTSSRCRRVEAEVGIVTATGEVVVVVVGMTAVGGRSGRMTVVAVVMRTEDRGDVISLVRLPH